MSINSSSEKLESTQSDVSYFSGVFPTQTLIRFQSAQKYWIMLFTPLCHPALPVSLKRIFQKSISLSSYITRKSGELIL
jgi:hypothetical protein